MAALEPLLQTLVECHTLISCDSNFQPFDFHPTSESAERLDGAGAEESSLKQHAYISAQQRSGEENRLVLLGEMQKLIDRLRAQIEVQNRYRMSAIAKAAVGD